MPNDAKIYLLDDDEVSRESLHYLLESVGLDVVSSSHPQDFLEICKHDIPGCAILDLRLPEMSGIDVLMKLRERDNSIPVVIITAYGTVRMTVDALKQGAVDVFEKPLNDQEFLDRVQKCVEMDIASWQTQKSQSVVRNQVETLTGRERQIFDRIVGGETSKKVANDLGISPRTVENHRAKILLKMNVNSVTELFAKVEGLKRLSS
ncbi:MAG: response regulator transcription factor [Rhodospirillales bacterium]|mgnify:FL=1|jgi:FixJ family two-component response regulator|nr:response regulator transcription factor [Rhodospirillaceae bacterium]MBT6220103.1 response regulator transcription factor [Rhodospirillaceae bacterium]MBT6362868.1 response regulator transcription factor [Rhodospirillaceae bacterium]MBT8005141.1 response regulator transcription factor [Rhodospirillales bacterium]